MIGLVNAIIPEFVEGNAFNSKLVVSGYIGRRLTPPDRSSFVKCLGPIIAVYVVLIFNRR